MSDTSMGHGMRRGFLEGLTPNQALLFGFLVALSVLSVALNIVLSILLYQRSAGAGSDYVPPATIGTPTAAAPNPSANNEPSQPQTFTITKDNHVRGNYNAAVTLVEFSDFQCPYCGSFHPTVTQILKDYGNKIRLVYKHFPLSFHENAQKAAEASECASEQGKFWEMHDKMFENQQLLGLEQYKKWARELKLNGSKFDTCLDTSKYASKVQADFNEGAAKGVNGTPATFINGQLVSGALPYASIKQVIDQALAGK